MDLQKPDPDLVKGIGFCLNLNVKGNIIYTFYLGCPPKNFLI